VSDRNFARAAVPGGLSEVELGRLAEQQAQSPEIRAFGQRMVSDHSNANTQLTRLAGQAGIPLPNTPDAEGQSMREQLKKLHGPTFDLTYIRGQISDHQRAVQLFEYEIGAGQDEALKGFASQALPILMQHLAMAQNVNAQLTGAAGPETATPPTRVAARANPGRTTGGQATVGQTQ
jgi:putative membrane protein